MPFFHPPTIFKVYHLEDLPFLRPFYFHPPPIFKTSLFFIHLPRLRPLNFPSNSIFKDLFFIDLSFLRPFYFQPHPIYKASIVFIHFPYLGTLYYHPTSIFEASLFSPLISLTLWKASRVKHSCIAIKGTEWGQVRDQPVCQAKQNFKSEQPSQGN